MGTTFILSLQFVWTKIKSKQFFKVLSLIFKTQMMFRNLVFEFVQTPGCIDLDQTANVKPIRKENSTQLVSMLLLMYPCFFFFLRVCGRVGFTWVGAAFAHERSEEEQQGNEDRNRHILSQ